MSGAGPDASTRAVLQALLSATREPIVPSVVQLPRGSNDEQIRLTKSLRLLPGQRWVVAGTRVNAGGASAPASRVLLKLFVGPKAKRHFARELAGAQRLAASGVATPALLDQGNWGEGSKADATLGFCAFVLYDWVEAKALSKTPSEEEFLQVVTTVAALHEQGLQQTDMHLGNFLVNAEQLYAVDVSSIEALPKGSAGRNAQLENLAVLFAQRYVAAVQTQLPRWASAYQAARTAPWVREDSSFGQSLMRLTQTQRFHRVRRYLQKSLRDCTEFRVEQQGKERFVCVREHYNDAYASFARQPEAVMATAKVLKAGNTATVVRAHLGGKRVIIKRYNIKGRRHQLLQTLRSQGRAERSWLNALRLQFLGLPTAGPLALLETRSGPLRSTAYLVLEDLGDADLMQQVQSPTDAKRWAAPVAELLAQLHYCGFVHGDTKATNFIVHNEVLHLIDLDSLVDTAARNGRWQNSAGYQKDWARLLRNWEGELQAPFAEALTKLGLV